jgi:hypothetical protein
VFTIVVYLNAISIGSADDLRLSRTYEMALLQTAFFLPADIFMVYVFIYFLLPKFIQTKKYFAFAVGGCCTLLCCFLIDFPLSYLALYIAYPNLANADLRIWSYRVAYSNAVFLSLGVAGVVTGIKLSKGWYLQQIQNTRLEKKKPLIKPGY